MTLASCLKKAGTTFSDEERADLLAASKAYQGSGMSRKKADVRAVEDALADWTGEKGRIDAEVANATKVEPTEPAVEEVEQQPEAPQFDREAPPPEPVTPVAETPPVDTPTAEIETTEDIQQVDQLAAAGSEAPAEPVLAEEQIQQVADRFRERTGLGDEVKVHVVPTEENLPQEVLEQAEREGARGEVVAVHHQGDIYLVADRHHSEARVEESLLHEGSHHGFQAILAKEGTKAYSKLWFRMGGVKGIRRMGKELGVDMEPYIATADALLQDGTLDAGARARYLVDEFLANAQGAQAYETLPAKIRRAIQEFFGVIRERLRDSGLMNLAEYTDADLAKTLRDVRQAMQGRVRGETTFRREAAAPMFARQRPRDEYTQENERIRTGDKTIWDKAGNLLKRQLAPGGLLPKRVFNLKIRRDSEFEVAEMDVVNLVAHLEDAVKAHYRMPFNKLPEITRRKLNEALTGTVDDSIPAPVRQELVKLRQHIDGLSGEYAQILADQIEQLQANEQVEYAAARVDLLNTIMDNRGKYLHRSYRVFDDPKWADNVPEDVLDNARRYITERREALARKYERWADNAERDGDLDKARRHGESAVKLRDPHRVNRAIEQILKEGTAFDSLPTFIMESKLGHKDLTILKHRQDIPPEIRALLGEYTDPRINFAKSATKLSRLIWNQRFLEKVVEVGSTGENAFLFKDKEAAPYGFTEEIATGEAYSPLDGYYTTPEIKQAFIDTMDRPTMGPILRFIVQANGMVKYGKAQPLDAIIKTPHGDVHMGDLQEGSMVLGANGRTLVTGVYPQGKLQVYRFEFNDGSVTEASGDHLWEVIIQEKHRVMTTKELLGLPEYRIAKRQVAIPMGRADYDKQDVPLNPYMLGILIGNGCFRGNTPKLSNPETEIIERIRSLLPAGYKIASPPSWCDIDYSITAPNIGLARSDGHAIRGPLERLGLWGKTSLEKYIPQIYKINDEETRMELLRGLLDSDGWVDRMGQPVFSTSSKQLALDVREVAESLGASILWQEKITASGNMGYSLGFRVPDAREWFWLPRKKNKAKKRKKPVKRTIVSIRDAGKKPCQCIQVSDPKSLYLTDRFIVTHNTVLSPPTALRNWMSAYFFTLANGHFNLKHAKTSFAAFKEYHHSRDKGKFFKYLRHLKELGVVYDTPYAGEMMRLLEESKIEDMVSGDARMSLKKTLDMATKFYQFGDDFWKIIGFENEKAIQMEAGLTEKEAEREAAERIRNTYPTYSMTGRFVNTLRRFPLAGTFVSFPAEIIRTTGNILRYLHKDMQKPRMRPFATRRILGLGAAAGFAHVAQIAAMSLLGIDADEEEALRDLAAPWQKNSNLLPFGRDAEGNLQYLDLSFMDPYNYWKRPINAILRDQPWEEISKEIAREVFTPFFGTDIAAGAVGEALVNRKETGGRVYNPRDSIPNQVGDIMGHVAKTIQPGVTSVMGRMLKAMEGEISPSGRRYEMPYEVAAALGFRASIHDPASALYYKSFEFKDRNADALRLIGDVAKDPNKVPEDDLVDAYRLAMKERNKNYREMIRLVSAAKKGGLSDREVRRSLRNSHISKRDTAALMRGEIPRWKPTKRYLTRTLKKARILYDAQIEATIRSRRDRIREMARSSPE